MDSADTGEATVGPATLTFSAADWDTPQTVTVTGVDDVTVDGNQTTTLTLSIDAAGSDDAFDALADQTVDAITTDDDTAGFTVTETDGGTEVDESGTTDTLQVVLDAQPLTNVVLDISSADTGEADASPASLTFTPANCDSAQTVTITGVDDDTVDGSQTSNITVSVNDAGSDDALDPVSDASVVATTTDDDSAGFTITETDGSTAVDESGTTDTFTVTLDAAPVDDVVIDIGSDDTGEATVSPSSLTITSPNWDTPQTVTVTGVDDADVDGDQTSTLTLTINAASSDDAFDAVADQTVSAVTTDDDAPGITVATTGTTEVSESGTTDTFDVVLDAAPLSDVVLTVSSDDTGEATVGPATLTFTSANWDTPQTVTVTGVDDSVVDGTQTSTVTIAVDAAASDDAFDAVSSETVSVDTADNDTPGFTVTETDGDTTVSEPDTTDTFTVVLDAAPESDVVLTLASDDTGEATVDSATLTLGYRSNGDRDCGR